jgi:hypothetical protein
MARFRARCTVHGAGRVQQGKDLLPGYSSKTEALNAAKEAETDLHRNSYAYAADGITKRVYYCCEQQMESGCVQILTWLQDFNS